MVLRSSNIRHQVFGKERAKGGFGSVAVGEVQGSNDSNGHEVRILGCAWKQPLLFPARPPMSAFSDDRHRKVGAWFSLPVFRYPI